MKNETVLETTSEAAGPAAKTAASDGKPAQEKKRARQYSEDKRFKIFSGSANRGLAQEICKHIGVVAGRDPDAAFR